MERKFKICCYGKGELAGLYLPHGTTKSAWNTFKYVWAARNKRLRALLEQVGSRRKFTPQEVRVIVEELGEP